MIVLSEFDCRIWSKHIMVKIARINIKFMWIFVFLLYRKDIEWFHCCWNISYLPAKTKRHFEERKKKTEHVLATEINSGDLTCIFISLLIDMPIAYNPLQIFQK